MRLKIKDSEVKQRSDLYCSGCGADLIFCDGCGEFFWVGDTKILCVSGDVEKNFHDGCLLEEYKEGERKDGIESRSDVGLHERNKNDKSEKEKGV